MHRKFPTVAWGEHRVSFRHAHEVAPPTTKAHAALVFAFHEMHIVLADIRGRGWCVPSGRIEPGETAEAAARREAWEEAGVILDGVMPFGDTVIVEADGADRVLAVGFIATAAHFNPIPTPSESRAVRLATRAELPISYYIWDELIEAIFDSAWERYNAGP